MKNVTKKNVLKTAKTILKLYNELVIESNNNKWFKLEQRQAYINSLEVMKRNNLIKDYLLDKNIIIPL